MNDVVFAVYIASMLTMIVAFTVGIARELQTRWRWHRAERAVKENHDE